MQYTHQKMAIAICSLVFGLSFSHLGLAQNTTPEQQDQPFDLEGGLTPLADEAPSPTASSDLPSPQSNSIQPADRPLRSDRSTSNAVEFDNLDGFSSDLSSSLHAAWRIRVISRIVGSTKLSVVVRFTPVTKEQAQMGSLEISFSKHRGVAESVDLMLGRGTQFTCTLKEVDVSKDRVEFVLEDGVILGEFFAQEKLIVPVHEGQKFRVE